jgi:hypothetical protein
MRKFGFGCLCLCFILAGCGNNSIARKYRIQQDRDDIGLGSGQIELELKEDKTYSINAGSAPWFVGTWSLKDNMLEITSSNDNIGTTFRVFDGKLFPFAKGKEVQGWSFVPN